MRGGLQIANRLQVDVSEPRVGREHHIRPVALVLDVVVLELGRPPRQEVPFFLDLAPGDRLVNHVAGELDARRLPQRQVVVVPIEMLHLPRRRDALDEHGVEVDDLSVGRRPFLSQTADVQVLVFDSAPLSCIGQKATSSKARVEKSREQ